MKRFSLRFYYHGARLSWTGDIRFREELWKIPLNAGPRRDLQCRFR
jgi:hypothetical protein